MGAERFVSKRRINRCTGAVRKQYLVCGKDIAKIKGKEAAEFRNHEVALYSGHLIRSMRSGDCKIRSTKGRSIRQAAYAKSRIQIRDGGIV